MTDLPSPKTARVARAIGKAMHFLVPLAVIVAGVMAARHMMETAPKAQRVKPPKQARLVEVQTVAAANHRIQIEGMGTVVAAKEVDVAPRISGMIATMATELVPGGRFRAGETLVELDAEDFRIALRQREAAVIQARSRLDQEAGLQAVARREFEMLGQQAAGEDRALMLREPQLASARAELAAAEAALEQARLNLDRTKVTAPFNAFVRQRMAQAGMQAGPATPLARLTGTDEYWVEVLVPAASLAWIDFPKDGAAGGPVTLTQPKTWPAGASRTGLVLRLLGDLEPAGRMARVLVSVADPESLEPANAGQPRLLLGDYVQARIEGREHAGVIALDRRFVREGGQVWVMGDNDLLDIRMLDLLHTGRDQVLVRGGLKDGDRVVTTDLSTAVAGMALRLAGAAPGKSP